MVTNGVLDSPFGPGSIIGAVAIVKNDGVRTARLLVKGGSIPRVKKRASTVGPSGRGRCSRKPARGHARRRARAIDKQGGE
jgi:hypothetical protein